MKIVVLDRSALPAAVALRRPAFASEWVEHDRTGPADVLARAEGAEILVLNKVRMPRDVLEKLPALRLISVAATGTDVVDVAACRELGIGVANVPAYGATTVSEHVLMLLLALRRSVLPYAASVREGRWQEARQFSYFDYPIRDLRESTLGIVGGGMIGGRVAELARGIGMRVLLAEHKGADAVRDGRVSFDQMLRESDAITLHCPLTPQTRGLIGRPEFEQMLRRPVLINTSRGGLVDEELIEWALDTRLIGGAAFDVATTEPPPADHPLMRLAGRPDFILTPHVAWASEAATQVVADTVVANIEAFADGRSLNRVD